MKEDNEIDRREFIKRSVLFGVVLSMPVLSSCGKDDPVNPQDDCITTADILGPFYKAASPLKEDIIPAGNLEPPLIIKGKVLSDCSNGLKDAQIEIWNADGDGVYDTSEDFKFRGKYQTQDDGGYQFKTIIPGRYLNGGVFRPSHIHFRITAPGFQELVSQIYFKDDPFIQTDPWASDSKAFERILLVKKNADNIDTVTFNIYLTAL